MTIRAFTALKPESPNLLFINARRQLAVLSCSRRPAPGQLCMTAPLVVSYISSRGLFRCCDVWFCSARAVLATPDAAERTAQPRARWGGNQAAACTRSEGDRPVCDACVRRCRPTKADAEEYLGLAEYADNLQASLLAQSRATPQFAAALRRGALCVVAVRGHLLELSVILGSESSLKVRP